MEKMPYQPDLDTRVVPVPTGRNDQQRLAAAAAGAERQAGRAARASRRRDAASLFALLTTEEVSRFISPPPTSVDGFELFIAWTLRQRTAGTLRLLRRHAVRDSTPPSASSRCASSIRASRTAEWGFALGSPFWGTGVFVDSAELVLDFAFDTLGVHRLEARAAVLNGRGNGALLKMGAVQECVLRKSFVHNGQSLDQVLYSILEDDWRAMRTPANLRFAAPVRVH